MRILKQLCCAALVATVGALGSGARLDAAEFGDNTPYYEDDGWLDITEWFDGNDYNPTDEAWWRWDDETYRAAQDTSGDRDSDGWYGYTTRDDDDWYYDYYDPTPYTYYDYDTNELYDYGSHYYDYDKDGVYDAVATYTDWDQDGLYDDYDYYTFSDRGADKQRQQQAQKQVARESRPQAVNGQIQKTKLVKVRGGKQHLVIAIQPQQQPQQQGQGDQLVIADLGIADDLKEINPKLGDKVTVKGPKAQVGKHAVILANSVELNGQTRQVNRTSRDITGKVLDTHKAKVRGKEHLMAIIETAHKETSRKVAVDLGPADRLTMDVSKGGTVTVSGFPVKVKDKLLVVAQSIRNDNQVAQIDRRGSNPAGQAQPAAAREAGQQPQQQGQGTN